MLRLPKQLPTSSFTMHRLLSTTLICALTTFLLPTECQAADPIRVACVGDSITEGIGASELAVYSQLVGEALQTQGYEYCINACGWSGCC